MSQLLFTDEDSRWQAVCDRNLAANGQFYYAVLSTGIYCRPGCSSRQPRRENVRFYEDTSTAVDAGFRACKRCKPEQKSASEALIEVVVNACRHIEAAEDTVDLAELAENAQLSIWHFQRLFSRLVGVSPKAYQRNHQNKRFSEALLDQASVTEAIYASGIGSAASVYSHNRLGMTPSQFRKGGKGQQIYYCTGASIFGPLVMAVSARGICCVEFVDFDADLQQVLAARFPAAQLIAAGDELSDLLTEVLAFVDAPKAECDLPLDIKGTAFQEQVWQALQQIPVGETMSYSQLAAAIGQPKASRAVAGACGANKLAVIIPCHRIVRSDGDLSGYRWGRDRKQQLLDTEEQL